MAEKATRSNVFSDCKGDSTMKRLGNQMQIATLAVLVSMSAGYAAAEPVFEHSRDAREFQYQREIKPVANTQEPMTAQVQAPIFKHSRDAREFSYQKPGNNIMQGDNPARAKVYQNSKDAREFRHQYE